MKSLLPMLLLALLASGARAQIPAATNTQAAPLPPMDTKSVSYALGMSLGKNLKNTERYFDATNLDADVLAGAIKDVLAGQQTQMTQHAATVIVTNWTTVRQKQVAEANLTAGKAYLEKFAKESGVTRLPNGICYRVITNGIGPKPTATDNVSVQFTGKLLNGLEFDSSAGHYIPLETQVRQAMPGWVDVLQLMPVGSKWEVAVPANLAYGERGNVDAAIPPNSVLLFELDLLGIRSTNAPARPAATNSPPPGK